MKALITGSTGFVGSYLVEELKANHYEVIPCSHNAKESYVPVNITNLCEVKKAINAYRPDVVINLAGQANVAASWDKPQLTFELNTIGLINILEAVRELGSQTKVIVMGSSDQYGSLGAQGTNVTEDTETKPMTPYAISKAAQEQYAMLCAKNYGMNVCMIRQFNLGGAGQGKGYMLSDFASGIAEIEAGRKTFLSVGNLDNARDFTHVKDACRAIRLIVEKGHSGEIYNLSSGTTYSAREILGRMISMSEVNIAVRQDPQRMRPSDTPVICGNHDKLTAHTGWIPKLGIDEILKDVLSYWRARI